MIAALASVGCIHHSPPDTVGDYTSRIMASTPIPKEYDPVVPAVNLNTLPKPPTRPQPTPEPEIPLDQPLSLEQAEELAMRHSPRIAAARSMVAAAASREQIAAAAFQPTLSTDYAFQGDTSNYQFSGVPPGGMFPVLPIRGLGPGNFDYEVLDLRLQWTVFQFGKRLALHDQAMMKAEITHWQLERTRQEVVFDVAIKYAGVLQARATQVVAEKAVVRAEATLKDVRNLAQNGVLVKEDVLRAEVFLADVQQSRITATSEAQIAVAALNRAIGINVSTPTRVIESAVELEEYPVRLEVCLAQSVSGRPEFNVIRLGVAAASRGEDATRADFLPTISTSGTGSHVDGSHVQSGLNGEAGIVLKWDLYDGGKRKGALRGAQAVVSLALAQGQEVCDTIAFETHVAYRNIEDAIGRLKQARTAVGQAEETLRLVRNRYLRGDAKPTDVVDAETALIRAEQNLNTARYDLLIGLSRMKFATGGTSQPTAARTPPAVQPLPAPQPMNKP